MRWSPLPILLAASSAAAQQPAPPGGGDPGILAPPARPAHDKPDPGRR